MTEIASINLTELVETHTSELYSWALHKVSDSELAKDLVQDTFLAAAEKIDTFKGNSSPKTWLFSILNHKIIDYYRKRVNQPISIENQSFTNFLSFYTRYLDKIKCNFLVAFALLDMKKKETKFLNFVQNCFPKQKITLILRFNAWLY